MIALFIKVSGEPGSGRDHGEADHRAMVAHPVSHNPFFWRFSAVRAEISKVPGEARW
jgi:hypothetical protein